jgi:hypothetical protein
VLQDLKLHQFIEVHGVHPKLRYLDDREALHGGKGKRQKSSSLDGAAGRATAKVQCTRKSGGRRTIAPLVVLVARSGTPPLQRLRGSLGFPAPAYFDRVTFSMSSSTGSAFFVRKYFQNSDAFRRSTICTTTRASMRIVEGRQRSLDVSVEVIERNGSELCCKQLVVECVQCFANRL